MISSNQSLLLFSRADHSISQVLTTSHVVVISTFTEGLLQKSLHAPQTYADWFLSRDVTCRG